MVFPHAGGSAAGYRDLTRRLNGDFDVHCIELPGHGRLRQQPFLQDMPQIVEFALEQTRAASARPAVFFGHSMGAWVAFLVAGRMRDAAPLHLFVSAARPPHLGVHRKLLRADHDEFVHELERLGGVPRELLADREALDLFLPALRADLQLLEPFRPPLAHPLEVPITVLRATGDDITDGDASAWRDTTTAACRVLTLPGGHFFPMEQPDLVCAVMRRALAA